MIQAAPAIQKASPEVWFLFVGEGPLRPDLQSLAQQLNVHDRAVFTGFRSDIQQILSAIDILVAPSLLEGFPMITLEAMAMSKPIVATQIQGIVEQISDEEEGLLVPSHNHKALAGAVVRLIRDKNLSLRVGAAARRKVETCFSVQKMIRETAKVYLSLPQRNYSV